MCVVNFKTIWKSFKLKNFKHIYLEGYLYSVIEVNFIRQFGGLYYLVECYSQELDSFLCWICFEFMTINFSVSCQLHSFIIHSGIVFILCCTSICCICMWCVLIVCILCVQIVGTQTQKHDTNNSTSLKQQAVPVNEH
jgi:ABC-type transport system involved in Fe-S cluster assembly fused permease/ATPase subunit